MTIPNLLISFGGLLAALSIAPDLKAQSAVQVPCVMANKSDLARDLSDGNPVAWAIVIGGIGGMSLGFVAARAKALNDARRMPPVEILAEVKKRRFRETVGTVLFLPMLGLGIVYGALFNAPLLLGVLVFVAFFQAMYFTEVKQRCPVCGTRLVYGYRQEHKVCPGCNAHLE